MGYKAQADIEQQDIIYIEQYANKGMSDQWIMKKLEIQIHVVQKYTTAYWKRKFNPDKK